MKKLKIILAVLIQLVAYHLWAQGGNVGNTYIADDKILIFESTHNADITILPTLPGSAIASQVGLDDLINAQQGITVERVVVITSHRAIISGDFSGKTYSFSVGTKEPTTPTNFNVVNNGAYDSQIDLTWDPFNLTVAGQTYDPDGYLIFRSTDPSFPVSDLVRPVASLWGQVTSYSDPGLSLGTTYHYKIMAYRVLNSGLFVSAPSATTQGRTKDISYTATALNEHVVEHRIRPTLDLLNHAEQKKLHYKLFENNSLIQDAEVDIASFASNTSSLWDFALEFDGNSTKGIYGELPTAFSGLSESWALEVYLKLEQFGNYSSKLLNGNLAMEVSSAGALSVNGTPIGITLPQNTWLNLGLVKEGSKLKIFKNGTRIKEVSVLSTQSPPSYIGNGPSAAAFVEQMQIGMVRAWKSGRSADQMRQDWGDVYRTHASFPESLVNEWVLDDQTNAIHFGVKNVLFEVKSTDLVNYPITWVSSFVPKSSRHEIVFHHHVIPGSSQNYNLELFEVGSGKKITTANRSVTMPGHPTTDVLTVTSGEDRIHLSYVVNTNAPIYSIYRKTGPTEGAQSEYQKIHEFTSNKFDASLNFQQNQGNYTVNWYDQYTVQAGNNAGFTSTSGHHYVVLPVYKIPAMITTTSNNHSDWSKARKSSGQFSNPVNLGVSAGLGAITLTWNNPSNYFSDSIQVTRDGEVIKNLVGETRFEDRLFTRGKRHKYGVHWVKDGQPALGEFQLITSAANGEVSGYFIDEKYNFVLENVTRTFSALVAGASETFRATSNESDGTFLQSGVFYGDSASYRTEKSKDQVLLDKMDPTDFQIVRLDTAITAVMDNTWQFGLKIRPSAVDGLMPFQFNLQKLTGTNAVDLSSYANHVFINLYRNEELIGISKGGTLVTGSKELNLTMKDTTGLSGETYAYTLRLYAVDAVAGKYAYYDSTFTYAYTDMAASSLQIGVGTLAAEVLPAAQTWCSALSWHLTGGVAVPVIDKWEIYRKDVLTGDSFKIADELHDSRLRSFKVYDLSGIPGRSYEYTVVASSGANQVSGKAIRTFPDLSGNADMTQFGSMKLTARKDNRDIGQLVTIDTRVPTYSLEHFFDGVAVADDRGKVLAVLPRGSYRDHGNRHSYVLLVPTTSGSLKAHRYKHDTQGQVHLLGSGIDIGNWSNITPYIRNTGLVYSTNIEPKTISDFTWNAGTASHSGFPAPTSVSATRNIRNKVLLTWQYDAFSEAHFEVYRDGTKIATVQGYFYFDRYDAQNNPLVENQSYRYEVRAIYDQDEDGTFEYQSQKAPAVGLMRRPYTLEGYVLDSEGKGVPNVSVRIGVTGVSDPFGGLTQVYSDSSGFYRFPELYVNSQTNLRIIADYYDHANTISETHISNSSMVTVLIDETTEVWSKNVHLPIRFQAMPDLPQFTFDHAFSFDAYPDHERKGLVLYGQTTGPNFDGVEILRYGTVIADLTTGEQRFRHFYEKPELNGTSDAYSCRTYQLDLNGRKVYSPVKSIAAIYPRLDPPSHLITSTEGDKLRLEWTDPYPGRSYFLYKNLTKLAETTSAQYVYLDIKGIPDQLSNYQLQSKLTKGGSVALSGAKIEANARYPRSAEVVNLTANPNTGINGVNLSWSYPSQGQIAGISLRKNGKNLVTYDTAPLPTSFQDTVGIPDIEAHYTLVAYKEKGGTPSQGTSVKALYPSLPAVSAITEQQDATNMTTTLSWTYPVKDFTGFTVEILEGATSLRKGYVPRVAGQTSYQFLFDRGVSGNPYTVQVTPEARREGHLYQAATMARNFNYPVLPTPVPSASLFPGNGLNHTANITWTYPNVDFDEWKVTLNGGQVWILPSTARSILIHKITNVQAYNVQVQAISDAGTNSAQGALGFHLTVTSGTLIPETFTATQDEASQITIDIDHIVALQQVVLLKDGVFLKQWPHAANGVSFTDYDVEPGVAYTYTFTSNFNGLLVSGLAKGKALGEARGRISGRVVTQNGIGIPGLSVKLSGKVGPSYLNKTATTAGDGAFVFTGLPVQDASGYRYTLYPDDTQVYEPVSTTVTLHAQQTSAAVPDFVSMASVNIGGEIAYFNGLKKTGDYTVFLYEVLEDGSLAAQPSQSVQTTDGHYNFNVPHEVDRSYEVRISRTDQAALSGTVSTSTTTTTTNVVSVEAYDYFRATRHRVSLSGTSAGDELTRDFIDGLKVPTRLSVLDYDVPITDYTWQVQMTAPGFDTLVFLNQPTTLQLPPLNYSVQVLDVLPLNSTSKTMLNQFRSGSLTIAHRESLVAFTRKTPENRKSTILPQGGDFENQQVFRYIGVPTIDLMIKDGQRNVANCNGPGQEAHGLKILPMLRNNNPVNYTLSLNLRAAYITKPGTYEIREGAILVKNKASLMNDRLLVFRPTLGWVLADAATGRATNGLYQFQAANVNTAQPFVRPIELYLFTDYTKSVYVTNHLERVVVTGRQAILGSDFFTNPTNSNANWQPLYVLHDPPGDGSSSSIQEGSTISFDIVNGFERVQNEGYEGDAHFLTRIGTDDAYTKIDLKVEIDGKHARDNSRNQSKSFSISANQTLSTSSADRYDFNSKQYLLGRAADIISGVGIINTYSFGRELTVNNACRVQITPGIAVDPKGINSTWHYTRHEVDEQIKYISDLLRNGAEVKPAAGASGTFSTNELRTRLRNFKNIRDWHELYFRTPVKVCNLAEKYNIFSVLDDCNSLRSQGFLTKDISIADQVRTGWAMATASASSTQGSYTAKQWSNDALQTFSNTLRKFKEWWIKEVIDHQQKKLLGGELPTGGYNYVADGLTKPDITHNLKVWKKVYEETPLAENVSFSAQVPITNSMSSNYGITSLESRSEALTFTAKAGVVLDSWGEAAIFSFGAGLTAMGVSENVWRNSITVSRNFESNIIQSYTLMDDDPGDHHNVWVMTDPTGLDYLSSPEFFLTGGKTSCPYEHGTIKRDDFELSIVDDEGNPAPTTIQIAAGDLLVFSARLRNKAPFEEVRVAGLTGGKNAGQYGETIMVFGNFPAHPNFSNAAFVDGSQPLDLKATLSKTFAPAVKGEVPFELAVGGICTVTNLDPDEVVFAKMNLLFVKSTSPVSLPTNRGDWLITNRLDANGDPLNRRLGIELNGLRPNDDLLQLDNVQVFARPKLGAQSDWRLLVDTNDRTSLKKERTVGTVTTRELDNNPVFEWEPDPSVFVDGEYQLKAVVNGEEGGRSESNLWNGRIDLTKPFPATRPAPADGILSMGDAIGVSMSEAINSSEFYNVLTTSNRKHDRIHLTLYDLDTTKVRDLVHRTDPAQSDFTVAVNGSRIDIVLSDTLISKYPGYIVKAELKQLNDLAGNQADDFHWHFKFNPGTLGASTVSMAALKESDANGIVWLNGGDISGNQLELTLQALDYDTLRTTSLLDRIELQKRAGGTNPGAWTTLTSATMDLTALRRGNDQVTVDLFNDDGPIDFRMKAIAGADWNTSNIVTVMVDVVAPEIVSVPEVIEMQHSFSVGANETLDSLGAFGISARLNGSGFGAIRAYLKPGGIDFVIDSTHADYGDIFNAPGQNLVVTVSGVVDQAGNGLSNPVLTLKMGNFGLLVSDISINTPLEWVVNQNQASVGFVLDGFDPYGLEKELDSIDLVFRKVAEPEFQLINRWRNDGSSPANTISSSRLEFNWDTAPQHLADGTYEVYAIAWGDNRKANYSELSKGVVDRTAPYYTEVFTPADQVVDQEDQVLSFTFSEALSANSADSLRISQIEGGQTHKIPNSLYTSRVAGNTIIVTPSATFKSLYKGEHIEVKLLNTIADVSGNVTGTNEFIDLSLAVNITPRESTNLFGALMETGGIDVSWQSYQHYDVTRLQRSYDGESYETIGTFDPTQTNHVDKVNHQGMVFYRLVQSNPEEPNSTSRVISVENYHQFTTLNFQIYPNPSNGKGTNVQITSDDEENELEITIFDIRGQERMLFTFPASSANGGQLYLPFVHRLVPGIYHIRLRQGIREKVEKLIVVDDRTR